MKKNILLEYLVPQNMTLNKWLAYREKHKITAKDYHKKYPKSKWKVVHSNPKQRGQTLAGANNMSYEKASAMHKAVMISKGKRRLLKLKKIKKILKSVVKKYNAIKDIENFTYTPEMEKHFIDRTNMHINLVQKWAKKIYDHNQKRFNGLIERCKKHDSSKFKSPEKELYIIITWQYKCKREGKAYKVPEEVQKKLNDATTHHVLNNRHHPACTDSNITQNNNIINKTDRDKPGGQQVDATNMNEIDIAEMVADWMAVSEERESNPKDWADSNINTRWKFNQHQIDTIYELIDNVWNNSNKKLYIEQITIKKAKETIKQLLYKLNPYVKKIQVVGSVSRQHKNIKDIDLVILPKSNLSGIIKSLDPNSSIGTNKIKLSFNNIDVDIWIVRNDYQFDYTTYHFSIGKKIITIKSKLKQLGYKLTRYGLFDSKGKLVDIPTSEIENFIKNKGEIKNMNKKIVNRLRSITNKIESNVNLIEIFGMGLAGSSVYIILKALRYYAASRKISKAIEKKVKDFEENYDIIFPELFRNNLLDKRGFLKNITKKGILNKNAKFRNFILKDEFECTFNNFFLLLPMTKISGQNVKGDPKSRGCIEGEILYLYNSGHKNKIKNKLIPFADTDSGDYFMFDYRKTNNNPPVILYEVNKKKIHPVAKTFKDFIILFDENNKREIK